MWHVSVETRQKLHPFQSSLSLIHEKLHQVVGLTTLEICCGAEFALSPLLFKSKFLLHYAFENNCKKMIQVKIYFYYHLMAAFATHLT